MFFAIEGVIGVGKTTLVRMLQPLYQCNMLLEVFEENPFLSDFYADRDRYAFQTQLFFLLSRYRQQRSVIPQAVSDGFDLISDYTFEKDALFARLNLKGDELDMYYRVQEALAEKIPPPTLVVYLSASTDTLMKRIALRDRPYERQMQREYIHALNNAYEEFFTLHYHSSPVLTIDASNLDFVRNDADLKAIDEKIREALALAPFQPELPMK